MGDNIMDDFVPDSDISVQQILNNLLSGDINLDLKTDVKRPQRLAALKVLASILEEEELGVSSRVLKDFIRIYLRFMVSYKRLGRREVIEALKGLLEWEKESAKNNPLSRNLID